MLRFISNITDDPIWPKACVRKKNEVYADGVGCTESAYRNLTSYV